METAIKIGGGENAENTAQTAAAIIALLEAGSNLRTPECLMMKALELLEASVSPGNTSISNCSFVGSENTAFPSDS